MENMSFKEERYHLKFTISNNLLKSNKKFGSMDLWTQYVFCREFLKKTFREDTRVFSSAYFQNISSLLLQENYTPALGITNSVGTTLNSKFHARQNAHHFCPSILNCSYNSGTSGCAETAKNLFLVTWQASSLRHKFKDTRDKMKKNSSENGTSTNLQGSICT